MMDTATAPMPDDKRNVVEQMMHKAARSWRQRFEREERALGVLRRKRRLRRLPATCRTPSQ
jgi:hypothetical protein